MQNKYRAGMKMNRLHIAVILLSLTSTVCKAANSDYEYCSISGYLYGENNVFMAELAQKIAIDKGIITDMVCSSAFKDGRSLGARFSASGKYSNDNERKLVAKVTEFKSRIQSAILKNAGY